MGLNTGSIEGRDVNGGGGPSGAFFTPHASWTCYSSPDACFSAPRRAGRAVGDVRSTSGLQRPCEFIKAFGERGGNLHVTQCKNREVRLVPLHQPDK